MDSDWGSGQYRALTAGGGTALVKTLGEAGDPLAILQRIVEQAILLVAGAEGSAVELAGAEGLAYAATAGLLSGFVGVRLAQEGSLSGLAVRSGLVLVSDDTETDDRVNREDCRRLGIRSMVCVPLGVGERPVGVLKVASSMAGSFAQRDVGVLSRLADFVSTAVAAALELARLSTELMLAHEPDPVRESPGDVDAGIASFVANVMAPGALPCPDTRRRIEAVLEDRRFEMLYQPVFELTERRLVGAEALARFTDLPYRPPDQWFADAERVGLGIEMELAAVRAALGPLPML
ncbi:MAG: GAF domain-containing protein, partial [Actinomycetota bacterium]|nr:GAF domain-containing protein [Actinomycetota bacterium]